jgi:hypothetical protein
MKDDFDFEIIEMMILMIHSFDSFIHSFLCNLESRVVEDILGK